MATPRLLYGFTELKNDEFKTRVDVIMASMKDNIYFSSPSPSLRSLNNTYNNYQAAFTAVQSGNRTKLLLRNKLKSTLITGLVDLSKYVMATAQNVIELGSSGFGIARQSNIPLKIGIPKKLQLKNGISYGELIISVKSQKKVKAYNFQYCLYNPASNNEWITVSNTSRKLTLKGLQRNTRYAIRVMAIGSGQQFAITDPVSFSLR